MLIKSRVNANFDGFTLLDYLSSRFSYLKRDEWIIRLSQSRFTVNDEQANEDTVIHNQDNILYDMPLYDEPEANLDYKIIYNKDNILAIDKPCGLMVHRHGINYRNNMIYHLRNDHVPPFPTADIVNRIDRNTSGIVLTALDKDTLAKMLVLFANRHIKKTYYAVVVGIPEPLCSTIDAPISKITENLKENNSNGRFCEVDMENGKESATRYETVESRNGHSLVRLFPKTGRTHQIRIHLNHIGVPIVGDSAYGMRDQEYTEYCENKQISPIITDRHLLHCTDVQFIYNGELVHIKSELPKEFVLE